MPSLPGGGGVTPYNDLYGEASPERPRYLFQSPGLFQESKYMKGQEDLSLKN